MSISRTLPSFDANSRHGLQPNIHGAANDNRFAIIAGGNITEKSDVCATANCMVYGAGAAGPHALTSIVGTYNGVTNPVFAYDANGNMASGGGRSITVTSFNMAASITDGANSAALTYDSEHQRIVQVTTGTNAGTTLYLNDPVSGAMEEQFTASGATAATLRDYILADGHMVALRTATPASAPQWGTAQWGSFTWGTGTPASVTLLYFTLDHLGSISVVADSTGTVVERDSYDAWGKRRNADGTAANCGTINSATTRGFTGQEMMDGICLINFNARIYDPSLGRFMAPDPVTETVYNLQVLNRYSYTFNNPLSLTDPSGNCVGFVGCFFAITTFGLLTEHVFESLLRSVPILGDLFVVLGGAICGPVCAAWTAAGVAGAEGGRSGAVLRAFVFTFVESEAFHVTGQYVDTLEGLKPGTVPVVSDAEGEAIRVGLHGLVGGLSSVAGNGKFGSGFLAAGFGALADEIPTTNDFGADLAIHITAGGIGSVLGGGKFGNGAVTAAFGYLFNYCEAHPCSIGTTAVENDVKSQFGVNEAELDRLHDQAEEDVAEENVGYDLLSVSLGTVGDNIEETSTGVPRLIKDLFTLFDASHGASLDGSDLARVDLQYGTVLLQYQNEMNYEKLEQSGYIIKSGDVSILDLDKFLGGGR